MDALGQASLGKCLEGAGEGGLGGQLLAQRESTDAAQCLVDHQALNQRRCGGLPNRGQESQHGLGHEGIRPPRPFMRRMPDTAPRCRREFLDPNPFQRMDDLLQLRRQAAHLVPHLGQQFVLNHVPALHDQFGSGSIHFAGVMVLASITASCQKWPPAPPSLRLP